MGGPQADASRPLPFEIRQVSNKVKILFVPAIELSIGNSIKTFHCRLKLNIFPVAVRKEFCNEEWLRQETFDLPRSGYDLAIILT